MINKGMRIGTDHLKKKPKKLGISIPDDSDMDLTIKFGALPIYVFAPMKTAPTEIASNVLYISPISNSGPPSNPPPAVLKNTR